jgi:hypothetical protein
MTLNVLLDVLLHDLLRVDGGVKGGDGENNGNAIFRDAFDLPRLCILELSLRSSLLATLIDSILLARLAGQEWVES